MRAKDSHLRPVTTSPATPDAPQVQGQVLFDLVELFSIPSLTHSIEVRGDTLAHVLSGDVLLIDRAVIPRTGDLVIHGTLETGLTVSYREGPQLREANSDGDDDPVFGTARALIRMLR